MCSHALPARTKLQSFRATQVALCAIQSNSSSPFYPVLLPFAALDGWKEWTLWSVCSVENTQQRSRRCGHSFPAVDQCQGSDLETRMCRYNVPESLPDPALQSSRSIRNGSFQIYHLIIAGAQLQQGLLYSRVWKSHPSADAPHASVASVFSGPRSH